MAVVNTDAIILRSYNLAEADRIVVCLTQTSGLVRAVARGARRMKSRFGAALEPFTLVRLSFYEKENRELVTISQAEIVQSQFALATRPETAEVLAYISEMVAEFAPPHEANEKLFRMVVACVNCLSSQPSATRPVLRYFEVWLLRLAGLFPDLTLCAKCRRAIGADATVHVDFEGQTRCDACNREAGNRLSAETQRLIAAIQRLPPLAFAKEFADLSQSADEQLAKVAHRLIARALERRPRTLIAMSGSIS